MSEGCAALCSSTLGVYQQILLTELNGASAGRKFVEDSLASLCRSGAKVVRLDAFGYASITVRAVDGRIVWQTPLARELLQSYFGEGGPQGAPATFGQWAPEPVQVCLRRHVLAENAAELLAASLAEPPRLAVEQGARRLTFRLHQQAGDSAGGGDWLIVMREVSDAKIIESMSLSFKLTAREAEVLYWVVKGKINRDIGDILGASPATVKKHLERVFAKLGVETRTAAAAMAMNRSVRSGEKRSSRMKNSRPAASLIRMRVRAATAGSGLVIDSPSGRCMSMCRPLTAIPASVRARRMFASVSSLSRCGVSPSVNGAISSAS